MSSEKRKKQIEAIKKGYAKDETLKKWLEEDPELAQLVIDAGLKPQEDIDALMRKSEEEHEAIYKSGKYTVDDIRNIRKKNEIADDKALQWIHKILTQKIEEGALSIPEIKQIPEFSDFQKEEYINNIYKKQIDSGNMSVDEIRQIPDYTEEQKKKIILGIHQSKIERGEYSIDQIRQIPDFSDYEKSEILIKLFDKKIDHNENVIDQIRNIWEISDYQKGELIRKIHRKKMNQYSTTEIETLIKRNEIDESDIRETLPPEQVREYFGTKIDIETGKWEDLPDLQPNRTDVLVLGIPGSGKTMFLAGLFHYAYLEGRLLKDITNPYGVKYLDSLVDSISQTALLEATTQDKLQVMFCNIKDELARTHPLTFIEMSGEVFKEFYENDDAKIPEKLQQYMHFENQKILILVIDYQEDINKKGSASREQLIFALKVLEREGVMSKIDSIFIIITKWDLCPNKNDSDAPADFLKNKGYMALKAECEQLAEVYNINFMFDTFSLGEFYGIKNDKYNYDETDSKRLYEWICDHSAYLDSKKTTGGKKKKWWQF